MQVSVFIYYIYFLATTFLLESCHACIKSGGQDNPRFQARRGKAIFSGGSRGGPDVELITSKVRVRPLNRIGQTNAVTPSINIRKGEEMYGRIMVPYSNGSWTLTVLASWNDAGGDKRFYSSPLWMFIKNSRNKLPTTSNYDKTSISFVSRGYSRIRMENLRGGSVLHLLVQALQDLSGLTIKVRLSPDRINSNVP